MECFAGSRIITYNRRNILQGARLSPLTDGTYCREQDYHLEKATLHMYDFLSFFRVIDDDENDRTKFQFSVFSSVKYAGFKQGFVASAIGSLHAAYQSASSAEKNMS